MSYLDGTFNARDVLILVVVAVRDDPLETEGAKTSRHRE